jgi:hypothetical protein
MRRDNSSCKIRLPQLTEIGGGSTGTGDNSSSCKIRLPQLTEIGGGSTGTDDNSSSCKIRLPQLTEVDGGSTGPVHDTRTAYGVAAVRNAVASDQGIGNAAVCGQIGRAHV